MLLCTEYYRTVVLRDVKSVKRGKRVGKRVDKRVDKQTGNVGMWVAKGFSAYVDGFHTKGEILPARRIIFLVS